ncbi:MAG: GNAT family N-acetyltransferase [Edaphobacter sp.]
MTQPSTQQNQTLNLRPATPADVPQILAFIHNLAEYEREPDAVHATEADLLRDGFGETKRFDCLIAELTDAGTDTDTDTDSDAIIPIGFALYFHNYSTWRGHAGIHIEDLFVNPEHRGKGIGKALLTRVAAIAVEEGCTRLQWDVLEWNKPAIGFYEQMGAKMLMDWRIMRVTGDALPALAGQSR